MSYNNTPKQVIPTPATATEELHNKLVIAMTLHYGQILTTELLIGNRKGCYAVIINSTYEGTLLEQLLGTGNAKLATEAVLHNLTADISTIEAI